jgi:sulfatase maturation enzyme AslB (radical SAM superfamily)
VSSKEQLLLTQQDLTKKIEKKIELNCWECLSRERYGYRKSGRQESFDYIPEDALPGESYILELQIDTNCNAACVTCGPHFSSLWRKQESSNTTDYDSSHHYDHLEKLIDFDKIRQIKFFGGEPLLNDLHLRVLRKIKNPNLVDLLYSTNGSIEPDTETVELWNKFNKVDIDFSIDDIGERFTYIRWPLKWSRVESNIIHCAKTFKNFNFNIHCTVNPFNSFYVDKLEDWVSKTNQSEQISLGMKFSPCHGTWGIDGTPDDLRGVLRKKYPKDHPVIGILNAYSDIKLHKPLALLINILQISQKRKQNWNNIFREVAEYYDIYHKMASDHIGKL